TSSSLSSTNSTRSGASMGDQDNSTALSLSHKRNCASFADAARQVPQVQAHFYTGIARTCPVRWILLFAHPTREGRPTPGMWTAGHAMMDGIEVNVLDVTFEVAIIADGVFPEFGLPNSPPSVSDPPEAAEAPPRCSHRLVNSFFSHAHRLE